MINFDLQPSAVDSCILIISSLVILVDVAVIQMCRMYRLSADNMVEEWVAFCSTKKQDNKRVTVDILDHLDREVP